MIKLMLHGEVKLFIPHKSCAVSFVMIPLTPQSTTIPLLANICKSASVCPATEVLHLYRK